MSFAPSAKRWTCSKCQVVRSKEKGGVCPVCWLVAELVREHRDGEHVDRENSSCVDCTQRLNRDVKLPPMSHKDCSHERTLAARNNCRRKRRNAL